ncbi:hypothetical protein FZEAL_8862 [Fusarium zealandicum]|uniref:PD-(D/E)XK nuclease-like domain-containing protein n=1 Tax=Fusarium zealandicum TaxID=1053134 RepID=A0A8H4XHF7_9HYPO|nr:hypothetical protein FZEAL_8862 [Fusarium zealandicum]
MTTPESDSLDAFIDSWLDSVIHSLPHYVTTGQFGVEPDQPRFQKKRDRIDMPTPPQSSSTPTRSSRRQQRSPKRPRPDDSIDEADLDQPDSTFVYDSLFDLDKTPAASTSARNIPPLSIPARPIFRQPPSLPSTDASSARSPSRTSNTRSTSPVKRSTLVLLKKPLYYVPIQDDPTTQLPGDILPTYDRIIDITMHREEFLPRSIESEIRSMHRRNMVKKGWFFDDPDEDATARHTEELVALRRIEEGAKTCQAEEASEAAWNLEVHAPLLKLALGPFSSLRRDLLTAARISKPFIPEMQAASKYDYTRAKMVDLGIRVHPSLSISERIRDALIGLPENQRCVNQTTYGPVRNDPIALVIETKISVGELEEARLQLGIWIAAWHQRIHALIEASSARAAAIPIITLPLIITMEHEWRLLFACDRGDSIEIIEDIAIGDTRGLIGLYTILATLRTLASWMQEEYLNWIKRLFNPVAP